MSLLRTAVAAVSVAAALTVPTTAAFAAPASPFQVRGVTVTLDPADPFHPVVSYRFSCQLPRTSPQRSGQTFDTSVNVRQGDRFWHLHGPFEVPRPYVCGERVTVRLHTDSPDGFALSPGTADVSVRETVTVQGVQLTDVEARTVQVRTPAG